MNKTKRSILTIFVVLGGALLLSALVWGFLEYRKTWGRGEALRLALVPLVEQKKTDQSLVASVILTNYGETRSSASRWSGIYWSCTFFAAGFSAFAGMILKFESFLKNHEGVKKDIAAAFSVIAALLITISTSGDFQRKWQANRIAAAELERAGYALAEKDGVAARSYLISVGEILHRKHMAIIGGTDQEKPSPDLPMGATPGK